MQGLRLGLGLEKKLLLRLSVLPVVEMRQIGPG